jgi:penicillin-binding protein 2
LGAKLESGLDFNRRALMVAGVGGAVWAGLAMRLVQLQTIESEKLRLASEENQFDLRVKTAPRGVIHDRNGEPIAANKPDYRVLFLPERAGKDTDYVIEMLRVLLDLPEATVSRIIKLATQNASEEQLIQAASWEDFSRVSLRLPDLPGVTTDTGLVRAYPHGRIFCHPIGYVAKPSPTDVDKVRETDPDMARFLQDPAVRVGKSGVEFTNEITLQGIPGQVKVEVDAQGRRTARAPIADRDPVSGTPMILSLDARLQTFAMERMGTESASAVVMDVVDGDLYVAASAPGFDPNLFVNGIPSRIFNELNTNDHRPLYHKAMTGTYPPGSTFKMITALAALEAGFDPTYRVNCPGFYFFGGRRFHCWSRGGHGPCDMRYGIKQSCDVYFYTAGLFAGAERIAKYARAFGLGHRYDLGMPGISKGLVPDNEWHQKRFGRMWHLPETLNISIGQGALIASPLHLAVMAAHIANGGKPVWPRLIRNGATIEPKNIDLPVLDVPADHMKAVQEGMWAVSNEPGGTARASSVLDLGDIQMAGKTGTAQVRAITMAERRRGVMSNASLPWHLRDHALFVAFAPYANPRYAISVVVEHGGSGSKAAAPIARDILKETLILNPAAQKAATVDRNGRVITAAGTAA